jgi:hypothetical protein
MMKGTEESSPQRRLGEVLLFPSFYIGADCCQVSQVSGSAGQRVSGHQDKSRRAD